MGKRLEGFDAFRQVLEGLLDRSDKKHEITQRRKITSLLTTTFVSLLRAIAPPRSYEIGAHEASFSAGLRRWLPECETIAIEAHPDVVKRHQKRLEALGVKYLNYCIGQRAGKVDLYVPLQAGSRELSMTSMLKDTWQEQSETISVEEITLDSLAAPDGQPRNVIWMDVEGAVAQVIWGGNKVLSHCAAMFVELEDRQRWQGQYIDHEVVAILADFGLRPFLCDVQRHFQYNLILIREGLLSEQILTIQRGAYVRRVQEAIQSATETKPSMT